MESKTTNRRVTRIRPQSGAAFTLRRGHTLRVIDRFGEQVSDLFAFAAGNKDCWLSSGRSLDYAGHTNLTTGDVLYANVSVDPAGRITMGVPRSRAGDWIDLRAHMDLWCGLTACSAEGSNNGTFKPIDFIISETAADLRAPHSAASASERSPE